MSGRERTALRRVALALSCAWLVAAPVPGFGQDRDRGERLAVEHCALCHVVGDHNRFGGIGSTPSFRLLAGMADGDERFQTFFARLPHRSFVFLPDQEPPTALPMAVPAIRLGYDDVADIAAFARTLAAGGAAD